MIALIEGGLKTKGDIEKGIAIGVDRVIESN
jgi:hypothetical protein